MLALLLLFVSPIFAKPNEDVKSRVGIITPKNRHHICRDWWDRRSRKFFTFFCVNVWGPKLRSRIFFDKYDVCQRTKLHVYRCFLLFCLIFYRRFKVCWKPCTGDNNSTQVKMQTKRKAVQWINVNCSVYMKLISESGAFSIEVTFAPSLYNSIETLRPGMCGAAFFSAGRGGAGQG